MQNKKSLEDWIYSKLNEHESMCQFELATDTVRCWIQEFYGDKFICKRCNENGFISENKGDVIEHRLCICPKSL